MKFEVSGGFDSETMLRDQIMATGAFLEHDGTVGFVTRDGAIIRSHGEGSFFVGDSSVSLSALIHGRRIKRAIAVGERITITV